MKRTLPGLHRFSTTVLVAGIVVVGVAWSLVTAQDAATDVSDEACLACHDGSDRSLSHSVHRLASQMQGGSSIPVACVSCHPGAEVHVNDPNRDNITNPSRVDGKEAQKICFTCHIAHREMDNYGFDPHLNLQLACSQCHKLHADSGQVEALLLDNRAEFCTKCHQATKVQFALRSNHPVKQNVMGCLSCHDMSSRTDERGAFESNRVCQSCHPQQAGPYLFDHSPVHGYGVDGDGCIECHNPHGSQQDHLLRQPNEQLCRTCHIVPGHRTAHSGQFANWDCATCHTEIHGSFDNRQLVDPNLADNIADKTTLTSCYCHGLR